MPLGAYRTYGKCENANWEDNIKIDHKRVDYVLVLTTSRQISVTATLNRKDITGSHVIQEIS